MLLQLVAAFPLSPTLLLNALHGMSVDTSSMPFQQSVAGISAGHKKRSYDNVSVNAVIRKITRKKLHGGIMGMLNGQRIRLLHDDWKLINQKCKNSILGYLEKRNEIEEAADQLIDYFQKTHAGKQLLMFTRFLREEAEDDGQNPQLLNLAKSIEQAVRSLLLEDQ